MRKVHVTMEVDLKNNEKGFLIVPTSEEELLNGKYAVVDRGIVHGWACKNSVTLKESKVIAKRKKSLRN